MGPLTTGAVETVNWAEPGPPLFELAILAALVGVAALALYLTFSGRIFPEFGRGLRLGLRGLFLKELRSRSRGWRPALLLTGYLTALALGVAGLLLLVGQSDSVPPTIGLYLFSSLSVGAVLLLAFITPSLTTSAVSGERERRTLDLLLVTQASALGLVSGKLLASLFYVLFLLLASLPAFALVYLFGGVPPRYLGMVFLVAAATATAHAALGLLLSALLRRTLVATVVAYLLVLGLVFGLPFASAVSGGAQAAAMARGSAMTMTPAVAIIQPPGAAGATSARARPPERVVFPPSSYLYASPLLSLATVLPAGNDFVGVFTRGLSMVTGAYGLQSGGASVTQTGFFYSLYVVEFDPRDGVPTTVLAWAPWVYHLLFSGAITIACLFGSALLLAPIKPWRAWRARRRRVEAIARAGG